MAKVKKAKRSTQAWFDDMRWRPVAEIAEWLLPHIGNKTLIVRDLTEKLVRKKIRWMRRYTGEHTLTLSKFSDAELGAIASRKAVVRVYPAGYSESVPASFLADHCFAWPNGDIRVGFRLPDHHMPSFRLVANWVFYLWLPDCVSVWPALESPKIGGGKAKPQSARKRPTRKALQRVGSGSRIEAGDIAATSGSPNTTKVGDTAAVVGRHKRKRKGKLTAEQIEAGRAYVRDHPELKPKQAYPGLRRKLKADVSEITLWRVFFQK